MISPNLVLISGSRNSKFSNYPAYAKKQLILKSANLYSEPLKMLHFLYNSKALEKEVQAEGGLMYKVPSSSVSAKCKTGQQSLKQSDKAA